MGAEVRIVAPPTMIPLDIHRMGVKVFSNFDDALPGVDVIIMLRLQLERQSCSLFPSIREYSQLYGLTPERVQKANENALIMHPGPINRGVEISHEVAESCQAAILEQVSNGVAVRMGLMYLLSQLN